MRACLQVEFQIPSTFRIRDSFLEIVKQSLSPGRRLPLLAPQSHPQKEVSDHVSRSELSVKKVPEALGRVRSAGLKAG